MRSDAGGIRSTTTCPAPKRVGPPNSSRSATRTPHNEAFTNEDTQRALDTTERFLAIGARTEADQVRKLRNDVVRIAHDREDAHTARANPSLAVGSDNLPPWREVLSPHPDVASGDFNAAEFAADLYSVANPNADAKKNPEYTDPVPFFERTYHTRLDGLDQAQRRTLVRRLERPPRRQPADQFRRRQTHSMLFTVAPGLRHPRQRLPRDVAVLAKPLDELRNTKIRRVALFGNQLEPAKPDTRGSRPESTAPCGANSLNATRWTDAFDIVADADRTSTSPGAALRANFLSCMPRP